MEEVIKKISQKTLVELEKAGKLAYPLYYKEIFNILAKEEGVFDQLNPKLLCINDTLTEKVIHMTESTVKEISNASASLKEDSQKLVEEIEVTDSSEIKQVVINFSKDLMEKITKMENKILELEKELKKAYKELLIDPLTKVYNRKALDKDLNCALKDGKDKDLDLVVAIVDLDNFKEINDTFGHLVGDFVLIKITEIIKKYIRKNDKIYRYGGDEFIIVFKDISFNEAKKIIEKIVNKISKTALKYKDNLIKVTVSIGVAKHKKGNSIDDLLKRADIALYKAKETKNRFVIEGE